MTVISLSKIRRDGGTQFRAALDPAVIAEYAEAMVRGEVFPAVVVFHDGTDHWLADGFYRCAAAAQAHLDEVTADVRPGTQREARLYAATEANRTHGVRMSNEEKRARVLAVLQDEEGRRWSDREIARRCGVGHPLVAEMRRQLEDLPVDEPRQGADGKVRKLPRKPEATPSLDDVGASNNAAVQHDEEPCKTKIPPAAHAAESLRPGVTATAGRTYHSLLGREGAALEGKPIVHRDPKPDTEAQEQGAGDALRLGGIDDIAHAHDVLAEATAAAEQETLGWVAAELGIEVDGGGTEQVRELIKARILELPREGYRQGEMAALEYVAEHVLVLGPGAVLAASADDLRTEIEQAVEALREAAPGPGPGEEAAELQAQVRAAQEEAAELRGQIRALEARLAETPGAGELRRAEELLQQARQDAAELRGQVQALEERLAVSARAGELAKARDSETAARAKVATLQEQLGAAIAEQVRHQKDAAQARAEVDHLKKEVAALKGQLAAAPRTAAPPAQEARGGHRIGDQVLFIRGKKSRRALVASFAGMHSAHLWIRPSPGARSEQARTGYWELAGLAELQQDPQQDPEAGVLAACLAAPPALDWIPALRARLDALAPPPAPLPAATAAPAAQATDAWRPASCGRSKTVHAAGPGGAHDRAKCGFRPPYNTRGWQEQPGAPITCPGCVGERLAKQAGAAP